MELKSLLVDSKTTWVEFPGLDGFEVELANLSRKELVALRKRCVQNKFNRKTRAFEETLDENKFIQEFTQATVKGWKGLKLAYLEDLVLVDLKGQDGNKELDYSVDNAESLVENSSEFDNWLNEVVFDLENFRTAEKGKDNTESGEVSKS
jgi:plastocyanin domain-containing protein